VHVWRPTANKCKIRKNLYFSAQGHCFRCQSKPVYHFLLVINYNLGPISHRFRDMATFRLKSLPRGWYSRSKSSKVIDLDLNGKPIGDFLLVMNCNVGPISNRFRDMASYWFKIANFPTPSHSGPSIGVTPMEFFGKALQILELESLGPRRWRFDDPSLHRFCLIHLCDRQTDGQTELRWLRRAIAVPARSRMQTE